MRSTPLTIGMASDERWISLRYPGRCRACGRELMKGDHALYVTATRAMTCEACAAAPERPSVEVLERGTAGASARREHERRRAMREQRARASWDRVGLGGFGAGLARLSQPQHERAWTRGAQGEERVAVRLRKLLDSQGVELLHDRRIPGSRANIDHLAIGPSGVTVIDAKNYAGKVRTEVRGGLLRPRTEHLLIGGRDRTRLVDSVKRQVERVREALDRAGEQADVLGVLCMADVGGLPLLGHPSVDGVAIDGPRYVAKIARRPGPHTEIDIARITSRLARAFPLA